MTIERERLVLVRTFASPWEAQLARTRLEAEEIEAVIADEHVARVYGGFGHVVGGIKLQVWELDAARAAEVLDQEEPLSELYLVTDEDAAQPRCPGCNSDRLSYERWSRIGFVSSWLLLGVPLPVPSDRWICRHCRAAWREEELRGGRTVSAAAEAFEPPDPASVVTVARFRSPWEAHLARTRLEAEGVEACVLEERLPVVNLLSGELVALTRLEVSAGDAERALDILDGLVDPRDLTASR